jgi:hypothetical protein
MPPPGEERQVVRVIQVDQCADSEHDILRADVIGIELMAVWLIADGVHVVISIGDDQRPEPAAGVKEDAGRRRPRQADVPG